MIIQPGQRYSNTDDHLVPSSQSFPVAFGRAMGVGLSDLPDLYQHDDMVEGSGFLNNRWLVHGSLLNHLQSTCNGILWDAQAIMAEDWEDVPTRARTRLACARAVLLEAMHENMTIDQIVERANFLESMMECLPEMEDDYNSDRYVQDLPFDIQDAVMLRSPRLVQSGLAALIGLQRKELEEAGFQRLLASHCLCRRPML